MKKSSFSSLFRSLRKHFIRNNNVRGTAMIEFALVVGLVIFLLLVFIDTAHYFAVRIVLLRGAQAGLQLATKLDRLQKDVYKESTLTGPSSPYPDYVAARQEVIDAATKMAIGSLIGAPGSGAEVELTTFDSFDEYNDGAQFRRVDRLNAAVIRPGEGVFSHLSAAPLNHPGRCSPSADAACTAPRLVTDTEQTLLRQYPVIVTLQARKASFAFLGAQFPISATAVGWVQEYPRAPLEMAAYSPTIVGGNGGSTGGNGTSCLAVAGCSNWNPYLCACCDTPASGGACPNGSVWDQGFCGCTNCPFITAGLTCPAGQSRSSWECYCHCDSPYFCPAGQMGPQGCLKCLDSGGNSIGPGK